MTFSALFVDFYCHSFLALRQTSQLLAVHFDTTVSISGEVSVKSKTLREDAERSETDGTISSFIFMLMPFFSSLDGEKMDLRGRKVQQWCGVTAWSLSSGVRSASRRLRRSVLLGWVVSGREARRPAAKMMERTCSMDARGQTAIGHQEVSPNRFLLCCAAYHAGSVCTYLSPPRLLMQGALFLPRYRHVLKSSCQKLEPEGELGLNERERCNRIITQGTSLKGTAAGGPIWALHQQTHTSIATTTGSQCCLIMGDKDECLSSQLFVQSFLVCPYNEAHSTVFPFPPNPRLENQQKYAFILGTKARDY